VTMNWRRLRGWAGTRLSKSAVAVTLFSLERWRFLCILCIMPRS